MKLVEINRPAATDLGKLLRTLADEADQGRITKFVGLVVCDDQFEQIRDPETTTLADSLVMANLLHDFYLRKFQE